MLLARETRTRLSKGKNLLPSPLRGRVGDGGVASVTAASASHSPNGRHPASTPTPGPSPQGGGELGDARRRVVELGEALGRPLRSLFVAFLMLVAPAVAAARPIEIRVVIVTTWNVDLNG